MGSELEILDFLDSHKIALPARRAILSIQPFTPYMIDLGKETLLSLSFGMKNSFENNITFTPASCWHTLKSTCPHFSSAAICNLQWAMCNVQCAQSTCPHCYQLNNRQIANHSLTTSWNSQLSRARLDLRRRQSSHSGNVGCLL